MNRRRHIFLINISITANGFRKVAWAAGSIAGRNVKYTKSDKTTSIECHSWHTDSYSCYQYTVAGRIKTRPKRGVACLDGDRRAPNTMEGEVWETEVSSKHLWIHLPKHDLYLRSLSRECLVQQRQRQWRKHFPRTFGALSRALSGIGRLYLEMWTYEKTRSRPYTSTFWLETGGQNEARKQ